MPTLASRERKWRPRISRSLSIAPRYELPTWAAARLAGGNSSHLSWRGGPCQLRRSREEIGELISRSLASDTPPRRDDARGCDGPINTFPQPAAVRPATKSCRPRPGGSRKRGPRSRQVCERVVHEKYTVRAIKRQPFDSLRSLRVKKLLLRLARCEAPRDDGVR